MFNDVARLLACPHCGRGLQPAGRTLRCPANHSFDLARQGYVSLLGGRGAPGPGDTAEMVAARAGFLASGHYAPIAEALADVTAATHTGGPVLDVGAGTGHYLGRVLDALPGEIGVALDVSKYASRRAAKAHPRAAAVLADAWRTLPVRDAAFATALNVFAPRNAVETHRVLRPGGHLVVVTPNSGHLAELVSELDLLTVDERKQQRLREQLTDHFEPVRSRRCEFAMRLTAEEVAAVVGMGPNAWHSTESLSARIAALPDSFPITGSVTVSVQRRR
ncbi:methyltransferase domain-containing protein [Saccharopolyspora sp. HNM0986]|uniref:putative RNA methyltransferase n=1 Tax=Saccharopolyspora galaxeae TaxID=2781241 RepID=UPI00190B0643|nr:methyltransferase domain-containing protein [Saccharopolyspora sp. HNM0986]MBK0867186.1 methyltransferase domain-containing protein [Saccharopolyspora sp. HNM0986]